MEPLKNAVKQRVIVLETLLKTQHDLVTRRAKLAAVSHLNHLLSGYVMLTLIQRLQGSILKQPADYLLFDDLLQN